MLFFFRLYYIQFKEVKILLGSDVRVGGRITQTPLLNKDKYRLRKEINGLLSKGMSNIYLEVSFEKDWQSQTFDFIGFKKH